MNDFDRYIFTHKPTLKERLCDFALAVVLGLGLCALILHSLDALFF